MTDDYDHLEGYNPDADLKLGCGLPTEFAKIEKGNFVVDLGSGAGNDCFVARAETGETGKVVGIDFTPEMIEKARNNADKLGFNNVASSRPSARTRDLAAAQPSSAPTQAGVRRPGRRVGRTARRSRASTRHGRPW